MSDSKKKPQAKSTKKPAAKKAPAKKAAAKKAPAKKVPAKKVPAKKQAEKKAAAPKKNKQTVQSEFERVNEIDAHEMAHQMMQALETTESIKIDFLDDARENLVEWAKDWVEEESSDFVSVTQDKVEINLNAKNGLLKRFFAKLFKR